MALELGCRQVNLGGQRVWRAIKAVSQLLVISFGFWAGVNGSVPPSLAFVGILLAWLGTEHIESVLVALGNETLDVNISSAADDAEAAADDRDDPDEESDSTQSLLWRN